MTVDKKLVVSVALGAMASVCAAGDEIVLPAPDLGSGTLMQAMQDRQSTREYAPEAIPDNILSNILWSAVGVNRKDKGMLTSPTGMNKQEVSAYAITANGAYKYLPAKHALEKITDEDLRDSVGGGQDFVKTAPLSIVLTAKTEVFGKDDRAKIMYGVDVGHASQDILLYCASAKLACVPRATMDTAALTKALKLEGDEKPVLNDVIGYQKK